MDDRDEDTSASSLATTRNLHLHLHPHLPSHLHRAQTAAKHPPPPCDPATNRSTLPVSSLLRLLLRLLLSLHLALHLVAPVLAVKVPAANCLPSAYAAKPPKLQWDPAYVDAGFDTQSSTHNLQITVWGNVTGAQVPADLPPPDDPYWTNPGDTDGKIIDFVGDGNRTTLEARINFLTYMPFQQFTGFCNESLTNGSCPLAPTFGKLSSPRQLPSFNMSRDMSSSYAFTSLWTTFLIISGEAPSPTIGCISVVITPDLGSIATILKFIPLVVLILTGVAVPLAGIFSPWGTSDIFHWTSNYGRDADVLRLVTPGFGDCLQYIQFIALTGALSLDYPGFFQPVVSQVGWSSLLFSESFLTKADPWESVVDGIYVTRENSTHGLDKLAQLVGMAEPEDIWPGLMVWLAVIVVAVVCLIQAGFAIHWIHRKIRNIPEEDLRSKNVPFVVGNMVRILFNFLLIPIVALSCFQLVIAGRSPSYTVALAAVTLALMICFASWLLHVVVSTRPKLVLFDDLPTLLRYGPLYNTYSDRFAPFALIPLLLNFVRGIAIGAIQASGVVQVVMLAICEVIQLLMTLTIRPYQSVTSMNTYQSTFAFLRLAVIMLMIAFAPSLGVTEGRKGWIGYTILAIHALVLVLGFFLSSFQTIIEVVARMLGAGGDDVTGLTRGGLSKIFGMRQLSRRVDHHSKGPSRHSQLSGSAMLDADKNGYIMPGGRIRSGSVASLGGIMAHQRHRSSSALDSIDLTTPGAYRTVDSASSYMPGTPGEASTFSFLAPLGPARHPPPGAAFLMETPPDPYYRPPRRRRDTTGELTPASSRQDPTTTTTLIPAASAASAASAVESANPTSILNPPELTEPAAEVSQNTLTAPGPGPGPGPGPTGSGLFPASRPDYSTREVDFYYGVRGPALNSDGPGRKLGTGPADPNGPVATATSWFKVLFGGKTKEKGKGFEVVRSSRMPPSMARNGGSDGGVPVAMSTMRNGPIDSDDDDNNEPTRNPPRRRGGDLLNNEGDPQSDPDEPDSPVTDRLPRGRLSQNVEPPWALPESDTRNPPRDSSDLDIFHDAPELPRKSSKRQSVITFSSTSKSVTSQRPGSRDSARPPEMATTTSNSTKADNGALLMPRLALPFDRQGSGSDKRPSSKSSLVFAQDLGETERPVNFGSVSQQRVNRFDPEGEIDLLGAYAEVVDENGRR